MKENQFEKDVRYWFIKKYKDTQIEKQLESATFVGREWTKVGFYLKYKIERDSDLIPIQMTNNGVITGPYLKSPEIEMNGGSILWIRNGIVYLIELFAYGNRFEETITNYKLIDNAEEI